MSSDISLRSPHISSASRSCCCRCSSSTSSDAVARSSRDDPSSRSVPVAFYVSPTDHPARNGAALSCVHHNPARSRRNPPGVGCAPPRGVTVFADRPQQTGASTPQKQRRRCPPSQRLRVRSSWPHVSPSRAPSRRLQRVSVSCAPVSRGQAPRRRPLRQRQRRGNIIT